MFIQTEQTPNPQTLKFLPGKVVMEEGTAFYQDVSEAENSPFARRLFALDGVTGVFFGSDFITITKSDAYEWQVMKPSVLGGIIDHFNSNDNTIEKVISKDSINKNNSNLKQSTINAEFNPKDPKTWGKVGRNEKCPCGSGKKYKNCCGKLA